MTELDLDALERGTGLCPLHGPDAPQSSCTPCKRPQSAGFLRGCKDGTHGLVRLRT